MPEYLTPGVYVEEIDTGSKPIEGVSTSTVGFLGVAERGPVKPTYVTSYTQFVRSFGTYYKYAAGAKDAYLAYAVDGFFQNGGKRCYVARVTPSGDAAGKPAAETFGGLTVTAVGPGTSGNRIAVKVLLTDAASKTYSLTVFHWSPAVRTPGLEKDDDAADFVDPTEKLGPTDTTKKQNRRPPTTTEVFEQLSPDVKSINYFAARINDSSDLVVVDLTPEGGVDEGFKLLKDGADGDELQLQQDDFSGFDLGAVTPGSAADGVKTGLLGLKDIDDISILCCPDEVDGVQGLVIDQCELQKDRFAVVQPPPNVKAPQALFGPPFRASKYAATYFPWLKVTNPQTGQPVLVPPCGHMAGIYARSDTDRGVHKAPANELVRGISDLQYRISKEEQAALNPGGVNAIRYFKGAGNLVWGARTTIAARDGDWKYVNVRRLFIYVEKSIERATQWVVFEPNDEPLWARLRRTVGAFLTRMWMDGMLQGTKREQAYFVKCDRTTMTQADIDNGKLIMVIGIAPVKPAEFVIFRIGQWAGGSEVTEA